MGMPMMPPGKGPGMPPMGGPPTKPPNAPQPEVMGEPGEGGEGLEGIDPALVQQLMEILGIDPDASEDEIANIIQMIMSGEGIEPGEEEAPPPIGAAQRRLGGMPQPGGPPPSQPGM